ncbi:DNA double-strand break repair Rad50 ATPase, putative [Entamoeba invadens IP1]|uniref:DNA double-strand break repair Rad50 ATPase, putative n=1 Tax=Entamoeba invadens IP1 TaxID=370355 RepID=UPI0002C3D4CE|nr:DNA double-strand break repair Rad50 ATPase, putative [Entamoeba invadens IP1]ELP92992.1 DNA double-strand break repair Rad50 ATPase, putative [Entamoeba invadens IP1]|eukprot:XP_004259763.1 DNA double-strand break repair Rad50 ATPase, putative [Entamoeba invadens IP1]
MVAHVLPFLLLVFLALGDTLPQTNVTIDIASVKNSLVKEVIPRFKNHIEKINKQQPTVKQNLEVLVTKCEKKGERLKKRVEEVKVNMNKYVVRMEENDSLKRGAMTKLNKAKKEKDTTNIAAQTSILSKYAAACSKTETKLRKMQNKLQKLAQQVEENNTALRKRRAALKQCDELKNIRIERNNATIGEIESLIKKQEMSTAQIGIMKTKMEELKGVGIVNGEYDTIRRQIVKAERKESKIEQMLDDLLKAMNKREALKKKFKEEKEILVEKQQTVKTQLSRDKAVLQRIVTRKEAALKKKLSATTQTEKNEAKNEIKTIKLEMKGLKQRVNDNAKVMKGINRQIALLKNEYEAKKKIIAGKLVREKITQLKEERTDIRKRIQNLMKRYNKIERMVLTEDMEPAKKTDLKTRLGQIENDVKIARVSLKTVSDEIKKFYDEKAARKEKKLSKMRQMKFALDKKIVLLRRLRGMVEKKLMKEKSSTQRKMLFKKITAMNKKIRLIRKRSIRIGLSLQRHVIKKARKGSKRLIHLERKERSIRGYLSRLQVRKEKYSASPKMVAALPQVKRLVSESTSRLKKINEQLKHTEDEVERYEAEVKEIKKLAREEAQVQVVELQKKIHGVSARIKALSGRKGEKIHDIRVMLRLKRDRLKRRLQRNKKIAETRQREEGVLRFNKSLRLGTKKIRKVISLRERAAYLQHKVQEAKELRKNLGDVLTKGSVKEEVDNKRDQLSVTQTKLKLKLEKTEFETRLAVQTLFQASGEERAIYEATNERLNNELKMLKKQVAKVESTLNQTQFIKDADEQKLAVLDDLKKDVKNTQKAIQEIQIQSQHFTDLVVQATKGVFDKDVPQKAKCEMCTFLAREALTERKYNAEGKIQVMRKMDRVCRKSKYPTTCYQIITKIGSRIYNDIKSPSSLCSSLYKTC